MGNTVINENEASGFSVTPTGITIGGKVKEYATYEAMLAETNPPKYASVVDASADPSVGSGSAFYKYSNGKWVKIHESESNDITWDTLEGKPNITSEEFVTLVDNSHTHANIGILNKFSADPETGNLLYNGSAIGGGGGTDSSELETRISTVETTIDSVGDTVDAQGITIANIQSTMVKTVNGNAPDENGNVAITVGAGDVTSEQFATLSGRVTTAEADIVTVQGIASSNTTTLGHHDERISVVEDKAHEHQIEGNYYYINRAMACHPGVTQFGSFNELSLPIGVENFNNAKAHNTGYSYIGDDGHLYFVASAASSFSGVFEDKNDVPVLLDTYQLTEDTVYLINKPYFTKNNDGTYTQIVTTKLINTAISGEVYEHVEDGYLSNVTDQAVTAKQMAVISNGRLYVRGTADAANNGVAGSLLGEDLTIDMHYWRPVGNDTDWEKVEGFTQQWLFIKGGKLYTSGSNKYFQQGTAGLVDGVSNTSVNINTPTEVLIEENDVLVSKSDWISISTGCYYSAAIRGTNGKGTIYLWGSNADGTIGDGVRYTHDMKKGYAWVNDTPGTYVLTGDSVYFSGKTYFSFDTESNEYAVIETTNLIGKTIPADSVYEIPTVVYTGKATPAVGALAYVDEGTQSAVGEITVASSSAITIGGVVYTRDSSKDIDPVNFGQIIPKPLALEDGTVYNDWEQIAAGYYHAAALRHNAAGESEVYVWGSNEYGNLGNGTYSDAALAGGAAPEGVNTTIQIVPWPHKLTEAEFPYKDVVKVQGCHYGTFLTRANGEVYFAGCNKRNYFGTGSYITTDSYIPNFTKLVGRFTGATILCETYGAMVVTPSPRLSDTADVAVKATLNGTLTPENIDNAIALSHAHSVDPAMIDAAASLVTQFADGIPSAVTSRHSHSNLADLNSISIRNGVLKINGIPYAGSGGGSNTGTGVTVDPTNLQLDQLTDVAGLSNLAGGFGLDVLSYRKVSDTEAYIHVCPAGSVTNHHGRYVDLFSNAESELISAAEQAKGLYGVPSNDSSGKGYIFCSKDLVTMMEKVAESSAATLKLYYVDTAHAASPASGTLALELSGAELATAMPFKWSMDTGSVVQAYGSKLPTSDLESVGIGSYSNEEKEFDSVYTYDGTLLVSKDDFEDTTKTYVFEDGTQILNIGSIVSPAGADDEGNIIYHSVHLNTADGTEVISAEQIEAGIYIKDGTMMVQVKPYMVPEKYDESLFQSGSIYIHPGNTNFSGMANQAYTFDAGVTAYVRETTAVDGVYPIKSVILKLNKAVTDGDTSTTTEFVPSPGSLNNPMLAAVYSPNRYSTSSVNGEYNSAVGFNASASGNQNTVVGDFSTADGLCNVVTGDMSHVSGLYNTVNAMNSNVHGNFNIAGGDENYVLGSGNIACGSYTVAIGNGNQTMGIYGYAFGIKNAVFSDAIAIGRNNIVDKAAKYSVAIGDRLDVHVKSATIIGQNGDIPEFVGNFPGTDTDVLYTITAAQYESSGYDKKWISNKQGLFFCAGSREGSDIVSIVPLAFTKYIVRPNNAFFAAATGSTNRNNIEPYIYEPFMQYTFTGVINMEFTDAVADANDATKFTFSKRDGGRVKTFDPGIEVTNASATTIDLDFNKATRWKLKDTTIVNTLIPKNFVDGAEAYVIVYGGVTVSWSAFAYGGNVDESIDANHFDGIVWVGDNEPRAVDSLPYGFQMVKLMVVDNTVVAQLLVDTCSDINPSGQSEGDDISGYTMRAEAAAAEAASNESDVSDMTEQAEALNNQIG